MRPIKIGNRKGSEKSKIGLGRWRLVVAVVFLLSFSLVYKLYAIQISESEIYKARAADQHEVSLKLIPERGKIYFTERSTEGEKLYAAASVRDLATIYSVPKDITNPLEMAEKFYEFFDREILEQELKNKNLSDLIVATSTKEVIINNYLLRFDKPGDPYEPLNKTFEINRLLDLYVYLVNSDYFENGEIRRGSLRDLVSKDISKEDLEFRNEKIYLTIKELDESSGEEKEIKKSLDIPGLGFTFSKYRYYPENEVASQILGYVGYSNGESNGHYGLEEFFDKELFGQYGNLKSEKGASANLIIVNDREYTAPQGGSDLVLTIDRNIEFFACEKLKETVARFEATGGSVIVVEPKTGAILAMCSEPNFNPNDYQNVKDLSYFNNPTILYQYEPGSVFKVITMAAAINEGKVNPATLYEDKGEIMISGWNKPIRNSDFSTKGAHGLVDMNYVLDNSLNTGAIFAMRQTGDDVFAKYVQDFGFGERSGLELGAESPGNINNLLKNRIKEIDAATASFGQGIAVTPLQMVMSYQAIANKGVLMKPYVVKKIINNGVEEIINPKKVREVISPETAATVSAMLVNIVEKGHSKRAKIEGYYLGGKTGTAQIATVGGYKKDEWLHTFIGVAPIDDPAFVMLVKIDSPKGVQYAEGSTVPLWRDIAEFILRYYQIPKTRK
ncbi:penicillin-binding protein 2 [Candidatus Falkowbacteria bacterium]|nr:penicillin-binding protein 2 [Candidatus Falkowbacteria bacterium]NCT54674.1 penicillin-binding protein 2 [Candidatus Falkowbacteria bacterium]